jgi:predicted nucleotidyltransferase
MDTTILHPDFKELLNLLNEEQVEYLLIGGYAVAVYGYPRGTVDIDFWIAVTPENADRLMRAMNRFGFGNVVARDWFLDPDKVVRMGHPPYRVEILTKISGVDFINCYARRKSAVIDGVPTQVISLEDLKLNKTASGREKDLNDLKHL